MSHLKRKPRKKQMEASRQWIARAFFDLLQKCQAPEKITLSEIATRAGVARQTLYRHFSGKEEILNWYLEKEFALFMDKSRALPLNERFHEQNLKLVFHFCRENLRFLKALVKQQRESLLLKKLEEFSKRVSPKITSTFLQGRRPVLKKAQTLPKARGNSNKKRD